MEKTTFDFRTREQALAYAKAIESTHDVDVRMFSPDLDFPYTVFTDSDTCYTDEGFCIYKNF